MTLLETFAWAALEVLLTCIFLASVGFLVGLPLGWALGWWEKRG